MNLLNFVVIFTKYIIWISDVKLVFPFINSSYYQYMIFDSLYSDSLNFSEIAIAYSYLIIRYSIYVNKENNQEVIIK
jgi:hypothetical protein